MSFIQPKNDHLYVNQLTDFILYFFNQIQQNHQILLFANLNNQKLMKCTKMLGE